MYEELGEFYEANGYEFVSPSRSYRYKILLDFCIFKAKEKEQMYKELLIFDLYLREKMKTRPDFADLRESARELGSRIYKKEEEERTLLPDYKEYNSKQLAKMTHLELFTYKVWDKGKCEGPGEVRAVLFDYKKRNPLTKEAAIKVLS